MTTTLQFNTAAASLLQGRKGGKLRMEMRDGTMFVRPTDRKAGPHVLTEYKTGARGLLAVDIEDKQVEKLQAGTAMSDKAQFNVVKDKYGWFSLNPAVEGDTSEAKATLSIKDSND